MKRWGGILMTGFMVGGICIAATAKAEVMEEAENYIKPPTTVVAMPLEIKDISKDVDETDTPEEIAKGENKTADVLEREKERLTADINQSRDRLDKKIAELKIKGNHGNPLTKFRYHQHLSKLEDQKAGLFKINNRIQHASTTTIASAKKDWKKVKTELEKELDKKD